MAKIEKFEDLVAWQKARILMNDVYRFTRKGKFSKDYKFAGQIQAAAISVMANIAEGFDRGRRAEFHQFLSMAKGSCGEVRSHLYAALDVGYLTPEEFKPAHELSEEVSRIINGLRSSIEGWESQNS
ncbi:MAG: four helix bundle protein [Candidatus Kapaibacterium sp.]